MICILNRKLLAVESDTQQVGDVKDKLQRAGIAYFINPLRSQSGYGQSRDASMAMSLGMRYNQFNTTSFSYQIYVRRKDYRRAQIAVYGSTKRRV